MSMLDHMEEEISELSYTELQILLHVIEREIEQYHKQSHNFTPNYSFEEP